MPVEFVLIPKNGSTFLRSIQPFLSAEKNLTIVCLRHPIQRFWAAAKEVHPLPSYKEKVDDCIKILQQETKFSSPSVEVFFNDSTVRKFAENHLRSQHKFIRNKKIDYVFRLESLTADLNNLIDKGVLKATKELEEFVNVKRSDHSSDDLALRYIEKTYNNFLTSYYSDDFILYNSIDMTKVNYGSSN